MSHPIDYTVRQNVALITIDNPPVNAIGAAVPQAIMDAIARAAADPQIAAVVVMGDPVPPLKLICGNAPRSCGMPVMPSA